MTWLDTLDDRQRQEIALARLYDTPTFRHGTTGHQQLILISRLAQLLDMQAGALQLARFREVLGETPLARLVAAAQAAGSGGVWTLHGATGAVLLYTDASPPERTPEYPNWHAIELTSPHETIVLIRIPVMTGEPGIEFHP